MKKYLYLTKKEWVNNWVEGGRIPISLASRFLSDVRIGTKTPDENRIHRSNVDLTTLSPFIHLGPDSTVGSLTITGASINGRKLPDIVNASYGWEDGLVICLANRLDRSIAERLGKESCVEIQDATLLKTLIDDQRETDGIMRACEYTDGYERDAFLKSKADEWQDEFRLYWPIVLNNVQVSIPPGLAKEIVFDPALNPAQVETAPERVAPKEFSGRDLEGIKALAIEYLRRTEERPISKAEICSVVLAKLKFNYDVTNRVLNRLIQMNLIGYVDCKVHPDHVELTPCGRTWIPRIYLEAPDPAEKMWYWTTSLRTPYVDICTCQYRLSSTQT